MPLVWYFLLALALPIFSSAFLLLFEILCLYLPGMDRVVATASRSTCGTQFSTVIKLSKNGRRNFSHIKRGRNDEPHGYSVSHPRQTARWNLNEVLKINVSAIFTSKGFLDGNLGGKLDTCERFPKCSFTFFDCALNKLNSSAVDRLKW